MTGSRAANIRSALEEATGTCWVPRDRPPTLSNPSLNRYLGEEWSRLDSLFRFEREAMPHAEGVPAGVDEAGRGPLAGPVVAAAAILPVDRMLPGLNDSKQVTPEDRESLYRALVAVADFGIGVVGPLDIDEINILQATIRAMRIAVAGLKGRPDVVLVDAVRIPDLPLAQNAIIRGDALCASIAAASIIAKVTRDRIMRQYDQVFPHYGFAQNKGYATPEHLDALRRHGPSPIHRRSFQVQALAVGEPTGSK